MAPRRDSRCQALGGTKAANLEPEDPLATSVKEIFERFDSSGDGTFDRQELGKLLKTLLTDFDSRRVSSLVAEIDIGGDGNVSYCEFLVWLKRGGEGTEQVKKAIAKNTGEAREERIKAVFAKYDSSGDGSLDISELEKTLQNLGAFTTLEIRTVCADLDKSQDGEVSYEEFAAWIKSASGAKEILKAKAILAPSDSDGLESIFYNYCGPGKADMDNKGFLRLMTDAKLVDKDFPAQSVQILFADPKVKPKGFRGLTFDHFEIALEVVAERKSLRREQVRSACLEATSAPKTNKFSGAVKKVVLGNALFGKKDEKDSAAAAAVRKKKKKEVPDWKRDVDNSGLWKVFGLDSSAGRALKGIYTAPWTPETFQRGKTLSQSTSLPQLTGCTFRPGSTSRPGSRPSPRSSPRGGLLVYSGTVGIGRYSRDHGLSL
eukprot:TRINITY_DN23633_c0_g1_i1.p1 TRINITY_DN23633_c0_g1~~TRINITY_DN23633_c0_g1_i1.p1  ORF type:complete len:447 (-),score=107.69 TRINITY_DN23633_c0_g1_i1:53-1348(-)